MIELRKNLCTRISCQSSKATWKYLLWIRHYNAFQIAGWVKQIREKLELQAIPSMIFILLFRVLTSYVKWQCPKMFITINILNIQVRCTTNSRTFILSDNNYWILSNYYGLWFTVCQINHFGNIKHEKNNKTAYGSSTHNHGRLVQVSLYFSIIIS